MINTGYNKVTESVMNESKSLSSNDIVSELSKGIKGKLSKGSKNIKFTCNSEKGYDTFNNLVKKAKSLGLIEYGTNNGNVTPSGMHYNFKTRDGVKIKITNVPSDDFSSYTPTILVSKNISESLDENESLDMNEAVALKKFARTDTYAYAGAEDLPSGSSPLIAHTEVADVIVCGGSVGAMVQVMPMTDDSLDDCYCSSEMKEKDAIALANKIASALDKAKDSDVPRICNTNKLSLI